MKAIKPIKFKTKRSFARYRPENARKQMKHSQKNTQKTIRPIKRIRCQSKTICMRRATDQRKYRKAIKKTT